MCADEAFLTLIQERLHRETLELKEAQSAEYDGMVLRALIEGLSPGLGRLKFQYVRLSVLVDSVWKNHQVKLRPQQVGAIARQMGFETKNSHGLTVVVPTPAVLLRACAECGYEDEAIPLRGTGRIGKHPNSRRGCDPGRRITSRIAQGPACSEVP